MHSEIIAVGSELLSFGRVDTNSVHIASRFAALGIPVRYKQVVGDQIEDIRDAVSLALGRSEIVLVTGGLGPTNDDVTREGVAEALSRELREDEGVIRSLEALARKWNRTLSENNRKQAMVPVGATVLPNPNGTAPGLFMPEGDKLVFVLPGPPRELNPILEDRVLPLIRDWRGITSQPSRIVKVASIPESTLDARVETIYKDYPEVATTILSSPGIISLYFNWQDISSDRQYAETRLDQLIERIRSELGISVYSDQEENLALVAGRMLKEKGMTLALAESCTGGLISKMLTDIPGSSEYFPGGVVSYSNRVKEQLLGVDSADLEEHGAVSEEVAGQMAEGVRKLLGSDIGLSVTGIAGPGGGTPAKPVGTVCIALSGEGDCHSWSIRSVGKRDIIRQRSANFALDQLRIWLLMKK